MRSIVLVATVVPLLLLYLISLVQSCKSYTPPSSNITISDLDKYHENLTTAQQEVYSKIRDALILSYVNLLFKVIGIAVLILVVCLLINA